LSMAVVLRQDTVLVQRRFRAEIGMVYEFPGGKVDANEDYIDAAVRELREETGLQENNVCDSCILESEEAGKIAFVVINSDCESQPICTDPLRQQEFFWMRHYEIPLADFHSADQLFIKDFLPKCIKKL